jgi:membrane protein
MNSPSKDRDNRDRGRDAAWPTHIGRRGWRDILWRTWSESWADNIGLISAGVAFYAFLAIVPTLAVFILCYGLFAEPATVAGHLQLIFALLPGDAATLIGDQLVSVTSAASAKTGLGLLTATLLSLYGVMSASGAIVQALNVAYDENETRSALRSIGLALLISVAVIIVGMVSVFAIAALAWTEALVPWAPNALIVAIRAGFWSAALFAAIVAISAIYRYGPNRHRAKWRWLTIGSVFAALGWLAASLGFGFYVANFANYNATYGALSAVVVTLMWLYFSSYILLLGAELNAEIEHQTGIDTTTGPPKQMGNRRAYVADTLGEIP